MSSVERTISSAQQSYKNYLDLIKEGRYDDAINKYLNYNSTNIITFNEHIKYGAIPSTVINLYARYQDKKNYTWIREMINKYNYKFSGSEIDQIYYDLNFFDEDIIWAPRQFYNVLYHDDYVEKYCIDKTPLKNFIKKNKIKTNYKNIIAKASKLSTPSHVYSHGAENIFRNAVKIVNVLYGINDEITEYIFESYFKGTYQEAKFTDIKLNVTIDIFINVLQYLRETNLKNLESNNFYEFVDYLLKNKIKIKSHSKELLEDIIHKTLVDYSQHHMKKIITNLIEQYCEIDRLEITKIQNNYNELRHTAINLLKNKLLELFEFDSNNESIYLKIRLDQNIDDFTNVDMKEYIKYLCINQNINQIKYILENKILILTEDIKSTLIYYLYNFGDDELIKILEIFNNYGLQLDAKIIRYLYDVDIGIKNVTSFTEKIKNELEKYPVKRIKNEVTLLETDHIYLYDYVKFMYNEKNIPEEYFISLANKDTRVFEHLVEKYNYKPLIQEICDVENKNFKHALLLRFA